MAHAHSPGKIGGRYYISDFPPCHGKGFGRGRDDKGAISQVRHAQKGNVSAAVENKVFIHLISNGKGIVLFAQGTDIVQFITGKNLSAGVLRVVENDCPGLWPKGFSQFISREPKISPFKGNIANNGPGEGNQGRVGVIGGRE